MSKIKVMQVGGGGYGASYVKSILEETPNDSYEYVGIVDPMIENSVAYDMIKERNIPTYSNIEDFYRENTADLVLVAAPIAYHAPYTVYALEHGSHVLCEKPIAATLQDATLMKEAEKRTGKKVMIGFQWSFAPAMLAAKRDFLDGQFGKPVRFRMHVLWHRAWSYFARNNWAGKLKDGRGNWVLDSVAHNATAHYLHNEFFMQGDSIKASAMPVKIQAELYRANDIENFDTCLLRAVTDSGCETLYYTTHAVSDVTSPTFVYEYENAKLVYNCEGAEKPNTVYAIFSDGRVKEYGGLNYAPIDKLHDAIETVSNGQGVTCDLYSATPHLKTINFLADYVPILNFPDDALLVDMEKKATYVPGIKEALLDCFEKGMLPSEAGVPWAQKPQTLDMSDYKEFLGRQYK
jgi:predicted dehydrogenase